MVQQEYPFYLANRACQPNSDLEVEDKYLGEVATRVARADAKILDEAIARAEQAAAPMRQMAAYQRRAILEHLVRQSSERAEELAQIVCIEAGKPIQHARGEVARLIDTLRIGAEESTRMIGEVMPLDVSARAAGYQGMWKHVPIGPCGFITPWNFPLNLVAHKIAPAIAVGCPFVLKPASATPVSALVLGEMLAETDLPEGAFSILPLSSHDAGALVEDERIKKLSFTGSAKVGWELRDRARKKQVTLELGGNAACVVDADANLDDAVRRIVFGGYYQSGQSCISVQRVLVHAAVYEALRDQLVYAVRELALGDPRKEETFLGPMISTDEAQRVEDWVESAVTAGAKLLCGGRRQGRMVEATVLEDVPKTANVNCQEVFGPVTVLARFDSFAEALQEVNQSDYGLQAGVFTRDINKALQAWELLEVGGVMINEVPSWRVDHMPYGGVKDSGLGREGLRWAMESMTEVRLLVIRTPPENPRE
jgi:acyl-CoA reductase-like NAD-dependent aldehyde dehydrogenase